MADSIQISGNVAGSVVVGDNNFVVNTNHGTIVYQQAAPQVQKRALAPAPPRAPRGFVNRTDELDRLENWIRSNEIVLLHAPDGFGKTTLLKKAANGEAARAMPDGVVLLESVDASGQALGPEDIIQRLFDALFESNPPLKVNATTARTYLSNTRPLILFDEVPLTPALQNALPDLLPQGALMLAVDLPIGNDFERLPVRPLPRPEALILLANKAAITLNDHNRDVLDALCALLNDVPLALSITGNVLRETADSPDAALSFLRETPDSSPDPIRCVLDRAFAYAFSRLSPDEQKVLAVAVQTPALSMAPDWLSYALGGVPLENALTRLQALGLLYANSPRLRLPPGFRASAQQEAAKQVESASLLAKLTEYLLANQSKPGFIAEELGNFAATIAASNGQTTLALAHALDPYLTLNGLWDLWGRTLSSALDAAKALGDRSAEAWALHQMGTRLVGIGQKSQAESLLNQALKIRESIGDVTGAAYSRHNLGVLKPVPVQVKKFWSVPRILAILAVSLGLFLGIVGLGVLGLMLFQSPVAPVTHTLTPTATPTGTFIPILTHTPTPSTTPDIRPPLLVDLLAEPEESYYGQIAERCQQDTTLTLFAYAEDSSGLREVRVIYWYEFFEERDEYDGEDDEDKNPRYEAEMESDDDNQYFLEIDHNEENRAENVLGRQGGWLHWQVVAVDAYGNQTERDGAPVRLTNSTCDVSAPRLVRVYTVPEYGTYGNLMFCGSDVSSYMELHVVLEDESPIRNVIARYYYRGKTTGPLFTLNLVPYQAGINYHYFNFLDHNAADHANQTLNGDDGQFIWWFTATDEQGNTAQSPLYIIDVIFRICPG
jgi:hypothetical protein